MTNDEKVHYLEGHLASVKKQFAACRKASQARAGKITKYLAIIKDLKHSIKELSRH